MAAVIIIEDNQLPITHYPVTERSRSITHYPLPITHYPLPITHYPLPLLL
ncbi:MAG: hypothetical protein ACRCU2_10750 [Planktothrix sp.]